MPATPESAVKVGQAGHPLTPDMMPMTPAAPNNSQPSVSITASRALGSPPV
ncbi:hypothetical protein [Streptomyces sp. NBC_00454]|uniref:hypothetical protein n=1 Tax=Streptomyces sp. NBC_00454 TaxID=2975747 RepID=UPI0030E1A5D6